MGYAGYVPAKMPPGKKSAVDVALATVQSMDTLDIISKLMRNVAVNPAEDKYKRVKLTNPKIDATVVQSVGGVDLLLALGWVYDEEDKGCLVVPKGVKITMAEVRKIEEGKDRLKKEGRVALTKAIRGQAVDTADKASLRAQLEADRQERAAQGPVEKGSVAQALPQAGAMVTGGDVFGSGCDC